MNIVGFLDTLQLFLTEYNYVSMKTCSIKFQINNKFVILNIILEMAWNQGKFQLLVVEQFLCGQF